MTDLKGPLDFKVCRAVPPFNLRPLLSQVRYLMRGINGEKLGLKCLNVGKILTI